jgi:hypothetical protein
MSDDDFDDDEPELEEAEEDDLDLDEDALVDDELTAGLDEAEEDPAVDADEVEEQVEEEPAVAVVTEAPARRRRSGAKEDDEDDVVDLDEELHPDDVEASLDVLLKEKTASERLDEDELDEEVDDGEPDERASMRITPRRSDEFLCSSCFLVLPLSQLADKKRQLCRDCA